MKRPRCWSLSYWTGAGLFITLLSLACAAPSAPDWVTQAMRTPVTVEIKSAPAVVLLDDGSLQIERDGERVMRVRQVVKVLNLDGKKQAIARVRYNVAADEVRSFKAWLIQPDGKIIAYGKKETADAALHSNAIELYGEEHGRSINASDDALVGSVFAYESVVRQNSIINQVAWSFSDTVPTQLSSFSLALPPGWSHGERVRNHAPIAAALRDGQRTWTLVGQPSTEDEPLAPPRSTLAPMLVLDLNPPAGSAAAKQWLKTGSWPELARYFSPHYDAAAQTDAAMRTRVAGIVAGASTSWEKIQRLTLFVQKVTYIFIAIDTANAGALIPRPATRVLQCNYGDCKDKSTLLRALLSAADVRSYPLIVRSNGRQNIDRDWPAVSQFNHCVLAIAVDATVESDAVIQHPTLGRLLVFDPTDQFTPVGWLYRSRHADHGLLLAGEQGDLIRLPEEETDDDVVTRTVRVEIDPVGNVAGTVDEHCSGVAASAARAAFKMSRDDGFRTRIERWLGATLPALRGVKIEPRDGFPAPEFDLHVEFASFGYGKLMRDELLTFKPAVVSRRDAPRLMKKPRTLPVSLRAQTYVERAEFTLPGDCVVDELTPDVKWETDFGSYRGTARFEAGKIIYERELKTRSVELPASDYEKVRLFYERIARHEQTPVVLRRTLPEAREKPPTQ